MIFGSLLPDFLLLIHSIFSNKISAIFPSLFIISSFTFISSLTIYLVTESNSTELIYFILWLSLFTSFTSHRKAQILSQFLFRDEVTYNQTQHFAFFSPVDITILNETALLIMGETRIFSNNWKQEKESILF